MKYLYNSNQIKEQLNIIFSASGTKWAIVGFVGYNALDHLPYGVSDLSVVCWPKAGGTNPDGVRRLIENGISVYFCDRLHQKIYWQEGAGLIVGSANLSENALGEGGLHEFGVYCDDESFDIKDILSTLNYEKVTSESLIALDIAHAAHNRINKTNQDQFPSTPIDFLSATSMQYPKQWKIAAWSELREDNSLIQKEIEANFGTKTWVNDNDVDLDAFQVGDFVLQIKTNDDGVIERANARWLLVDFISGKRNNKAIVQISKLDNRTPPPFEINSNFKKNLKKAFNFTSEWSDIYDDKGYAKPEFIKAIVEAYGDGSV